MSDRICQFFLRGRCQRQPCEFKHVMPEGGPENIRSSTGFGTGICHFFLKGNCRFGSNCRFRHEKPAPEKPPVPAAPEIAIPPQEEQMPANDKPVLVNAKSAEPVPSDQLSVEDEALVSKHQEDSTKATPPKAKASFAFCLYHYCFLSLTCCYCRVTKSPMTLLKRA